MGGTCGAYGGEEKCIQGNLTRNRPLRIPRTRGGDNIKMDVEK